MYMFRTSSRYLAAGFLLSVFMPALAQDLGQPVTEEDLVNWDISVAPDGEGLPAGSGTAKQGEEVWAVNCLACHGESGRGGPAGDLTGGLGTLATEKPVKTVTSFWPHATTLFDYVRRAMPYHAPGSLTDDEVYALTAYLLHQDKIIRKNTVLNARTLPKIKMPNQKGFISYWPPGSK